jgi:phosphoribosylformylglycinamidine synthase
MTVTRADRRQRPESQGAVCSFVHNGVTPKRLLLTTAHHHTMTGYTATVTVRLKHGVLDPEAATTERALERLGFELEALRSADRFEIDLDADSAEAATGRAEEMAERLLANPTIHDYEVDVEER